MTSGYFFASLPGVILAYSEAITYHLSPLIFCWSYSSSRLFLCKLIKLYFMF